MDRDAKPNAKRKRSINLEPQQNPDSTLNELVARKRSKKASSKEALVTAPTNGEAEPERKIKKNKKLKKSKDVDLPEVNGALQAIPAANEAQPAQLAEHANGSEPKSTKRQRKRDNKKSYQASQISGIPSAPPDQPSKRPPSPTPIPPVSTTPVLPSLENAEDQEVTSKNPSEKVVQKAIKNRSHKPRSDGQSWKLSESSAGRYLNQNVIFANSNKEFILVKSTCLQVCFMSNSLVRRTIHIGQSDQPRLTIFSAIGSSLEHDMLYVATFKKIHKINWKTGDEVHVWQLPSRQYIPKMALFITKDGKSATEHVVAVETADLKKKRAVPVAYSLSTDGSVQRVELLEGLGLNISDFHTETTSNVIVMTGQVGGRGNIVIGCPKISTDQKGNAQEYSWYQMQIPSFIKASAFRVESTDSKPQQKRSSRYPVVNVAVADSFGAIHIYYNLLSELANVRGASYNSSIIPKKLHWHRRPIHALQWSSDGSYLISGGEECTLVNWQLTTGTKSFLPHLPSMIMNLTFAHRDSRVALHLSDNSVIILSNVEFQAKALIAGLQASDWKDNPKTEGSFVTQSLEGAGLAVAHTHLFLQVPLTIRASHPSQVSVIAPSALLSRLPLKGSPYLQTFDFKQQHHISRQAIVRTNVTIRNVSGNNTKIREPVVYSIKTSCDGQWLATVEIWIPEETSVDGLQTAAFNELSQCAEVSLKFWQWDVTNNTWILTTEVKNPHHRPDDDYRPGLILELASDPSNAGFSSLGEDGILKVWRLKTRTLDETTTALAVAQHKRPDSNTGSMPAKMNTWILRASTALPQPIPPDFFSVNDAHPRLGCLAYSDDGSALAACYTSLAPPNSEATSPPASTPVYFIDSLTGAIQHSSIGPINSGDNGENRPISLAFMGRYLFSMSSSGGLRVWDVVKDTLHMDVALPPYHTEAGYAHAATHLAVNRSTGTIAVALATRDLPKKKKYKGVITEPNDEGEQKPDIVNTQPSRKTNSQPKRLSKGWIGIFRPQDRKGISYRTVLPHPLTALHAVPNSDAWVLLDSAAEIRTLAPKGDTTFWEDLRNDAAETEGEDKAGMEERLKAVTDIFKGFVGEDETDEMEVDGAAIIKKEQPVMRMKREEEDTAIEDGLPVVTLEQVRECLQEGPGGQLPSVSTMFDRLVRLFSTGKLGGE